jgi:adenylate cyclase
MGFCSMEVTELISTAGHAGAQAPQRRLAAVAFIDVVGYSRLMELDEGGTHRHWMSLRSETIEPLVSLNGGHIVKSTGDGFLLQFNGGLDAVKFALDVQRVIGTQADVVKKGRSLDIRVSAHLCEIISEHDDVFGEGVNVAARLLDFAEPGGIVISGALHERVHQTLPFHVVDLGFLTLRNIERRVRALKIAPLELTPPAPALPRRHQPSIAVLPVRTYGIDPPDGYLAEGIVHEIVASLASLRELFVISSSSTIAISLSLYDRASISHVLGVRYLLASTIAHADDGYRLLIELSDTETNSVIWTESFKFSKPQLFNVQQEIAEKVAYALLPHIRLTELHRARRKQPANMDAYDFLLRGMYCLYRLGEEDFGASRTLFQKAIEYDPTYGTAHAMMAKWYILQVGEGRSVDVRADSRKALQFASLALEDSPSDPLALAVYGHTQSFLFAEYDRAIDAFDRAIAANPNSAIAWGFSAPTYCYVGEAREAIERAKHALALSPIEPFAYFYRTTLTLAHYFNCTYDDSVFWGRKTMRTEPRFVANLRPLTASLAALGQLEEAREIGAALIKLDPDFRVRRFCDWYPLKRPEQRALLVEHLLAAGLPE